MSALAWALGTTLKTSYSLCSHANYITQKPVLVSPVGFLTGQ